MSSSDVEIYIFKLENHKIFFRQTITLISVVSFCVLMHLWMLKSSGFPLGSVLHFREQNGHSAPDLHMHCCLY